MTGEELYEQNRIFYAEDWGVDLIEWDDMSPEQQFSWEVCAYEYVKKQVEDSLDEEDN